MIGCPFLLGRLLHLYANQCDGLGIFAFLFCFFLSLVALFKRTLLSPERTKREPEAIQRVYLFRNCSRQAQRAGYNVSTH